MTHLSPHLNAPRPTTGTGADRFTLLHQRQRKRVLRDRAAHWLLTAAVIAAAVIAGYLLGIATSTAEALPRILAEAQSRAAW